MALAANVRQYFPPRRIQQMEDDLADLAHLWEEGPWGWSLATKQRYLKMGVPADQLPSDEWLAEVRRLSSREFGVNYYARLNGLNGRDMLVPCQARFCTSLNEVQFSIFRSNLFAFRAKRGKNFKSSILKSPWSSSGRGNIIVGKDFTDQTTMQRIERVIREQGGIVVEPFYDNKALDFALEFDVSDDGAHFLGYSVFSADETGHYGGNVVASQEKLLGIIDLPQSFLDSLISYHIDELGKLKYRGPVGIDMMRLRDGRVHPCVEVNFRRTMGWLAIQVYEKLGNADRLLAGNPEHGFSARVTDRRLTIDFNG